MVGVVMVVSVVVMIITVMIAHGVSNGRAADSTNYGADGTAHHGTADRASNASRHSPA
jgi:hypothetical protein